MFELSADTAAFLRGSVSIVAASCRDDLETELSRAIGCRVSLDRRRVTIFLAASQSSALLAAIRSTHRVAVVFTGPSTHRALQLKATDAVIEPRSETDARLLDAYRDAMVPELAKLGFGEDFTRTMLAAAPEDVVAVSFTPSEAFEQTPGPSAGKRIEERR